jgi:phosphomannomutase
MHYAPCLTALSTGYFVFVGGALNYFYAMTFIRSISGFRGTIGGAELDNLTPPDIVRAAQGYGSWVLEGRKKPAGERPVVIVGRDARPSGDMVLRLVTGTLMGMGIDVIDLGLSTTPTVEMAVVGEGADGGIILTASHNPVEWNALKLLDADGAFISAEAGAEVIRRSNLAHEFAPVQALGQVTSHEGWIDAHIQAVLDLPLVDRAAVAAAGFIVAVDAVHSTGGIAVPRLLKALGVDEVIELYCEPHGRFPHNPEPRPEHLTALSESVVEHGCQLGITVDPDVDRLAFVCEDGSMFGEEYTLVAVADYILKHTPGPVVSNLSSTRALRDVAQAHGQVYTASAVGEVNVVKAMTETQAIIGGEGNGGVIYPTLHAGRDALVGIALFLSHLAHVGGTVSALRSGYPHYEMVKAKIDLDPSWNVDQLLADFAHEMREHGPSTIDGVKLDLPEGWVHLRKSNTEPIVRVYAEASTPEAAAQLVETYRERLLACA